MVRFDFPVYIGCECKDSGPIIKCHDTGVTLGLHLKTVTKSRWMQVDEDYRIPDGTTAVIRVKKPDNTVVLTDDGITFEGGSVVVCSKLEQAYTAPGICTAELSLYNPEGKRLTSATFTYEVEKECVCDEDERSEDYMNVLGGMVKEVNAAATSAAESAAEAEEWAKKAAAGGGGSVDSLAADKVTFSDGETFQQKYDSGELTGPAGADGKAGKDGVPGYTPVKGIDYFDGAPGYTPVKNVDYFDGKDGIDGYTPVKGVDYFDGKDGSDGVDGITPHIGTNDNWWIGDTDTGVKANGKDGAPGTDGNGIASIVQTGGTGAPGTVDTHTITMTNGETYDLNIYNGKDGADGTDGSGGSSNVYSTEETVVGTWIDGKPIYRKCFVCSVSMTAKEVWVKVADVGYLNIDTFISAIGQYSNSASTDGRYRTLPSDRSSLGLNVAKTILSVTQNSTYSVTITAAVIEYTKTTDTATIAIPSAVAMMAAYEEGVQNA